jgi:hypothetical protein
MIKPSLGDNTKIKKCHVMPHLTCTWPSHAYIRLNSLNPLFRRSEIEKKNERERESEQKKGRNGNKRKGRC